MPKRPQYSKKIIDISKIISLIKPGNRIFLNSGMPPAYILKNLLTQEDIGYYDLDFIQLFSISNFITQEHCRDTNFRLIMFRTGESINSGNWQGRIDFIPANLIEIPFMFATGALNVDVAILQQGNSERIVAEGRFAEYTSENTYEIALIVDEDFQGKGIGSFLVNYLIRIARDRKIQKLSASVLTQNQKMLHVFKKADVKPKSRCVGGVYELDFIL